MVGANVPAANVTLADVIREHGAAWLKTHRNSPRHLKVLQAIATCRTAAQGGKRQWCECGYQRYVFFSCRNRHCPQCQTKAKEEWRLARLRDLLPVPYFHLVFTLPHQLNRLIWWSESNQRTLFKALFDAAAQTLLQFGHRELGGQMGFSLILHTWDQQLRRHPHVHGLIPSGAIADNHSRWVAGGASFLFSVRALSKVYRAKYLEALNQLWQQGELDLPPELVGLTDERRKSWIRKRCKHSWVVYAKPPFAGPARLLDYLSRYTHRVAISNHRIKACADGHVEFTYRDRRDGDRVKPQRLACDQFIARFLSHVLPDRFTRIRHYGFLATRNKRKALAVIRELIGVKLKPQTEAEDPTTTLADWLRELFQTQDQCPCCGRTLKELNLQRFYIPLKRVGVIQRRYDQRGPP